MKSFKKSKRFRVQKHVTNNLNSTKTHSFPNIRHFNTQSKKLAKTLQHYIFHPISHSEAVGSVKIRATTINIGYRWQTKWIDHFLAFGSSRWPNNNGDRLTDAESRVIRSIGMVRNDCCLVKSEMFGWMEYGGFQIIRNGYRYQIDLVFMGLTTEDIVQLSTMFYFTSKNMDRNLSDSILFLIDHL